MHPWHLLDAKIDPLAPPLRVLVPAGIGDVHWALLKLASWAAMRHCLVDVWVYQEHDDRKRSGEYIGLVPWARFAGYWDAKARPMRHGAWTQIRRAPNRVVFAAADGFDDPASVPFEHIVYMNAALEEGLDLDTEVLPYFPTVHDYDRVRPFGVDAGGPDYVRPVEGPYALVYVTTDQIYTKAFTPETLAAWAVNLLAALAVLPRGTQYVLTGSWWDKPTSERFAACLARAGVPHLNLCGETPFARFYRMIGEAVLFVGLPGGNTILSVANRRPTVILWPAGMWPNRRFRTNWAPPHWERWYAPIEAWPCAPGLFADTVLAVVGP